MCACQTGHLACVEALLAAKADLHAVDAEGATALVVACDSGHAALVPARGAPQLPVIKSVVIVSNELLQC